MELSEIEEEYAYKKHTNFLDGYDSDSSDSKSDFDEWYYANKPPSTIVNNCDTVKIYPFTLVRSKKAIKHLKQKSDGFRSQSSSSPKNKVKTNKKRKSNVKQSKCDKVIKHSGKLTNYKVDDTSKNKITTKLQVASTQNKVASSKRGPLEAIDNQNGKSISEKRLTDTFERLVNRECIFSLTNSQSSLPERHLRNSFTKADDTLTLNKSDVGLLAPEVKNTNNKRLNSQKPIILSDKSNSISNEIASKPYLNKSKKRKIKFERKNCQINKDYLSNKGKRILPHYFATDTRGKQKETCRSDTFEVIRAKDNAADQTQIKPDQTHEENRYQNLNNKYLVSPKINEYYLEELPEFELVNLSSPYFLYNQSANVFNHQQADNLSRQVRMPNKKENLNLVGRIFSDLKFQVVKIILTELSIGQVRSSKITFKYLGPVV
ncbi:hypothetical protein FQR65_LT09617 [Abscondita terminalis]|nr:hypothetical protein FQR65_LT09617 [Abscondita terminalis]